MKAIRLHARGGPELLRFEGAPAPPPGPGEVLVRVRAAAYWRNMGDLPAKCPLEHGW
jgi:NADPH:quinone reductase-like Zn-dependent oxidoreductase